MTMPGARVSTVMGRTDFEWALQFAGSAEKAVALDTRPRIRAMVSISVCEREEGALKCTNTNREGDGRAARSGDVGAPGRPPADGGRVRFERQLQHVNKLACEMYSAPPFWANGTRAEKCEMGGGEGGPPF